MKNLKVVADIGKNRLYFTFAGKLFKKDMDKLYTDVRFCVADLQSGFDVISDFSECKLAYLNGIPTLRKIMNYLITNGVGDVVRVLPGKNLIYRQIINLATRVQGYRPIYVSTLEEAEDKLANSIKRNGLRLHLHQLPVEYMIDDAQGKGHILNISTSGCAVVSATLKPSIDVELLLIITFMTQDAPSDVFEIKARVARVESDTFAAEFTDLDNDRKEKLWQCLVYESQREVLVV